MPFFTKSNSDPSFGTRFSAAHTYVSAINSLPTPVGRMAPPSNQTVSSALNAVNQAEKKFKEVNEQKK